MNKIFWMNPFLFHPLQLFPLPLAICPPNFTSSLILTKSTLLPVCEWVGGHLLEQRQPLKDCIPEGTDSSSNHSWQ